jgi:Pro-kumamolisin, activation domain
MKSEAMFSRTRRAPALLGLVAVILAPSLACRNESQPSAHDELYQDEALVCEAEYGTPDGGSREAGLHDGGHWSGAGSSDAAAHDAGRASGTGAEAGSHWGGGASGTGHEDAGTNLGGGTGGGSGGRTEADSGSCNGGTGRPGNVGGGHPVHYGGGHGASGDGDASIDVGQAALTIEVRTTTCAANLVSDVFSVTNRGGTPIRLSDITVKLWAYDTGPSSLVTHVRDTGSVGVSGGAMRSVHGVSATTTPFAPGCGSGSHDQANWEVAIGTDDPGWLLPGASWAHIQSTTNHGDCSSFNPGTTTWYSSCETPSANYVADPHYAVYVRGALASGASSTVPACRSQSGYVDTSPVIGDFVLYGERSVTLGSTDTVLNGDIGVAALAPPSFGPQLVVGDASSTDPQNGLLAHSIQLGAGSDVGDVETSSLTNNGARTGAEAPFPSSMPPLPVPGASTPGASNITVAPLHALHLHPGAYGAVTVNGVLFLEPGVFSFATFTVGDGALVFALPGTADVRVAGTLLTGIGARLAPLQPNQAWEDGWGPPVTCAQHAPASQLSISVSSYDAGSGGQVAATIGAQNLVEALIVVPHGTLSIGKHTVASGAFAAFDVSLADGVRVAFEGGLQALAAPQQGTQLLSGNVPPAIATAPVVGPLPSETSLTLAIALPLQVGGAPGSGFPPIETFIEELSQANPPPPLTPASFAAAYGPSVADYANVTAFVNANGLSVTQSYTARNLLSVSGTVAKIQTAFGLSINQYLRADGSTFYAPANAPSINLTTSLLGILGLDNYSRPMPTSGGSATMDTCFPSPNGFQRAFDGTDFRNAYIGSCSSATLEGQGQTIALYEFDSYLPQDILSYASGASLGEPPLDVPGLAGNSGAVLSNVTQEVVPQPTPASPARVPYNAVTFVPDNPAGLGGFAEDAEVDLDISMILSMAPQANLIVYETDTQVNYNSASPNAVLAQMAEDDVAQVISMSWNWPLSTVVEQMAVWSSFAQFAAQSQSFFKSAGDLGALIASDPYNASASPGPFANALALATPGEPLLDSPYMTVVGATELQTTSPGGSYQSETTWNDANIPRTVNGNPINSLTTGGFLVGQSPNPANANGSPPFAVLPVPTWQLDVPGNDYGEFSNPELNNPLSARMIPDVSIVGSAIGIVCGLSAGNCGGPFANVCASGSSAAAPLWAGYMALANQANGAPATAPIGFVNPLLYEFAVAGEVGVNPFNDVGDGSNNNWFDNGQPQTSLTAVVPSLTAPPPTVALPFAETTNAMGVPTSLTLLPGAAGAGASGTPGLYHAVQGYDMATGLGSPTCTLLELLAPNFVPPGTTSSSVTTITYHQVGECEGIPTEAGSVSAGSGLAFVVFGIDSIANAASSAFTLEPGQIFAPLNAFGTLLSTDGQGCTEPSETPCASGYYTFPQPSLASAMVGAGKTVSFSGSGGTGTQYIMMEVSDSVTPGTAGAVEQSISLYYSSSVNCSPDTGGSCTLESGVTMLKTNTVGGQLEGDCSLITLE